MSPNLEFATIYVGVLPILIFGGSFYSRLTRNIREDKGYTYSPFSVADLRRRAGTFWTSASVRNAVTGPTILEML